jgi:DNA repair protein RadC
VVRETAPAPFDQQVGGPDDAVGVLTRLIGDEWQEVAVVLFLDFQNRLIGYQVVGRGGLAWCPMEPREVLVAALMANAASIIVAHNHPSGALQPSPQDVAVTKRLNAACDVIGLGLLDHIIVTRAGHVSMQKAGLL